jgi:hypothetical protein
LGNATGEVLDLGYSLYIAMIKGECSFDVRREKVYISDWFRRQTEKFVSVSAAAKNVSYIAYYIAKYPGWTTSIVAAGSAFFSPS